MKKYTGKHNNKFTGACVLVLVCFFVSSLLVQSAVAENSSPSSIASATTATPAPDAAVAAAETNSAAAVVAPKPALAPVAKTTTTSQLANLIGGLALILVLIYGLSWFVKRFAQGGFMQNSSIKMLASLPLGTRERLMLVEVGGKQILLGVTAAQINSLHVFDEPVVQVADKSAGAAAAAASDFSQKLMAILQQKNSGKTDTSAPNNIK